MQCLTRDKQDIYISLYESKEEAQDEQGRYTGEFVIKRSDPIKVEANVSAARGAVQTEVFGQLLEYDRTVIIDNPSFEITEAAVLWIDKTIDEKYDYIITKIARTPNYTSLAVTRVEVG